MPNPDLNQPLPLAYHDRTQHVLPNTANVMQTQLDKVVQYSNENDMKLNTDKTKVAIFNTGRKYDFMPRLYLKLVIYHYQIRGVTNQNMKQSKNQFLQEQSDIGTRLSHTLPIYLTIITLRRSDTLYMKCKKWIIARETLSNQ